MKTIRIALMSAALLGATVSIASAQGGRPGQGQNRQMEMLFEGITLDSLQKVKVDSISAHFRAQMPPMTQGTPPSQEERAKRMDLMQKQRDAIRGVLTKEQQAQFDKNVAEMQQRMQQRGGGRPPAGR